MLSPVYKDIVVEMLDTCEITTSQQTTENYYIVPSQIEIKIASLETYQKYDCLSYIPFEDDTQIAAHIKHTYTTNFHVPKKEKRLNDALKQVQRNADALIFYGYPNINGLYSLTQTLGTVLHTTKLSLDTVNAAHKIACSKGLNEPAVFYISPSIWHDLVCDLPQPECHPSLLPITRIPYQSPNGPVIITMNCAINRSHGFLVPIGALHQFCDTRLESTFTDKNDKGTCILKNDITVRPYHCVLVRGV